jgi:hypothetical protein
LRVTVSSFVASILTLGITAGIFDPGGPATLLFYAGWAGALLIAALTLPLVASAVLIWSARRYLFA